MTTIQLIETIDETITVIASETVEDAAAGKTLHRFRLEAQLRNRDGETDIYSARIEPEPEPEA